MSLLAFATIDTVLVARASASDLAALAVGAAAYVTVFVGLMGVVMALSPVVGQLHGAERHEDAGRQVHQAVWLALGLATLGCTLLVFPTPFLALARTSSDVDAKARGYLLALALSLPASLLFTVWRAFNIAVSRPKAVMKLQIGALALKAPLSAALVFGVPAVGVPALGVVGCGVATAVAMWSQVLGAAWLLQRDRIHERRYDRYALLGRGLDRPNAASLAQLLRLGVPMGLAIGVEVTGFTFMALFIARLGTTAVAGHQLAANLVALLFMLPLALGNATGALVAQRVGAGDAADARRLGWHGLIVATAFATVAGGALYAARAPVLALYTANPAVLAAAWPLTAWVALFHIADAVQAVAAHVLRAHKIVVVPVAIYVAALWGVGLGGGYALAFADAAAVPAALRGASGFWIAATAGLVLAAAGLAGFMAWVTRRR